MGRGGCKMWFGLGLALFGVRKNGNWFRDGWRAV